MRRGQPPHPLNSDARQDATLAEAHDRYELVARFTTPSSERGLLLHDLAEQRAPSSAWPLRLRLQNVTAYRALLHNASEEPASTTAAPAVLLGFREYESAGRGAISLGDCMLSFGLYLLSALFVFACLGVRLMDEERQRGRRAAQFGRMATQTPFVSADGEILVIGSRVQTQYTLDEGGNDEWYAGTVGALLPGGDATVVYDDGDTWTGSCAELYMLRGDDQEHALPQGLGNLPLAHGVPIGSWQSAAYQSHASTTLPMGVPLPVHGR